VNTNRDLEEFSPSLEPAAFDWYRATVKHRFWKTHVSPALLKAFPDAVGEEVKPLYGYERAVALMVDGDRVATVMTGGNAETAFIEGSGFYSARVRDALLSSGAPFRPSRMDACLDYDEVGLADALFDFGLWYANQNGLKINQVGDWHNGKGRTLYIGSRSSPVYMRIYEKGHKAIADGDENASPHWVRVEIEVKPDKKRREAFCELEASDLFRCGWVADFMAALFVKEIARVPVGYQRSQTTVARQRRWLVKNGRRIIAKWLQDFDTPEQWGRAVAELIEEVSADDCE